MGRTFAAKRSSSAIALAGKAARTQRISRMRGMTLSLWGIQESIGDRRAKGYMVPRWRHAYTTTVPSGGPLVDRLLVVDVVAAVSPSPDNLHEPSNMNVPLPSQTYVPPTVATDASTPPTALPVEGSTT